MNILVDPDTGHLTGIVDWADAAIEPFGMALWGLEAVLGCSGPGGWAYFEDDTSHSRLLFQRAFLAEIGECLSDQTCTGIDQIRNLGVLLRYGFTWETGVEKPVEDTSLLDVFLRSEFIQLNPRPKISLSRFRFVFR
jgi:DNA excision repair protein ERCC-4